MLNEMILTTTGLCKTFQKRDVIKNCSLHVERGTIYGLLGANGAGKTTIFKMLSGLITPTNGRIQIFGEDIDVKKNHILRNIGTLIETPIFYEHLSATENLKIHLAYMGLSNIDIDKVLSKVGLFHTNNLPVSTFSLGMRQRLAIARAIIHKPKLLILDEPINGLDPMGIKEMRQLFINLVKEDQFTILISSHILSEIEQIADTIGILENGLITEEITIDDMKKQFPNGLEEYFFHTINGGK